MRHVTYEWVMLHMNESRHIWMSHVTYEWVMSHMNESWHIWMSRVTYEWVMSHMNESCPIWINDVTCEKTRHTCVHEARMVWMSHATGKTVTTRIRHMWLSHVTCDWVMSSGIESCHIWLSHVIGMFLEALHAAYEPSEVPSSVFGRGGMDLKLKGGKMHAKMLVRFSRIILICSMTRFLRFLWHNLIKFVTWLMLICEMTYSNFVTRLIRIWDMTYSDLWHDLFSECWGACVYACQWTLMHSWTLMHAWTLMHGWTSHVLYKLMKELICDYVISH